METFVQPKITGYRQLNEQEAALMNRIKQAGIELQTLIIQLRQTPGLELRWVDLGQDDLQVGLMKLTRAVAKPTSF